MRSWPNSAQDRVKFDCTMSAGASLATLIQDCNNDSGMFGPDKAPGASAEMYTGNHHEHLPGRPPATAPMREPKKTSSGSSAA